MIERGSEVMTVDVAVSGQFAESLPSLRTRPMGLAGRPSGRRVSASRRRAARLIEQTIDFVANDEFERRDAAEEIFGPEPPESTVTLKKPPTGLPSYLRSLYRTPLLTREQELYLFRRYNYVKYLAAGAQRRLRDAASPRAADMDRLESLLEEAGQLKTRLVKGNLRLVIHIVKRCNDNFANFFELVSDGNLALIQAVEKYDYARGVKFGTYATWVIRRRFARVIPQERSHKSRFVTGTEDLMFISVAHGVNQAENPVERELKSVVPQWIEDGLQQLPDREREVIQRRFGVGSSSVAQTLKEVGHDLGITKERVRQIETRALAKLQRLISPEAVEVVYPGLM